MVKALMAKKSFLLLPLYRGLLVEEPEGLLELGPHRLWVGVLHQELGAQLERHTSNLVLTRALRMI